MNSAQRRIPSVNGSRVSTKRVPFARCTPLFPPVIGTQRRDRSRSSPTHNKGTDASDRELNNAPIDGNQTFTNNGSAHSQFSGCGRNREGRCGTLRATRPITKTDPVLTNPQPPPHKSGATSHKFTAPPPQAWNGFSQITLRKSLKATTGAGFGLSKVFKGSKVLEIHTSVLLLTAHKKGTQDKTLTQRSLKAPIH